MINVAIGNRTRNDIKNILNFNKSRYTRTEQEMALKHLLKHDKRRNREQNKK